MQKADRTDHRALQDADMVAAKGPSSEADGHGMVIAAESTLSAFRHFCRSFYFTLFFQQRKILLNF
jgi:hypothetical protein